MDRYFLFVLLSVIYIIYRRILSELNNKNKLKDMIYTLLIDYKEHGKFSPNYNKIMLYIGDIDEYLVTSVQRKNLRI